MSNNKSIGVVGARGFVGAELLTMLETHANFQCSFAYSGSQAGEPVAKHVVGVNEELIFEKIAPLELAARDLDAVVLCLPDKESMQWVSAFQNSSTVLLDISSDHRFDNSWTYGLSEHFRSAIQSATRISNPGCYATACQLALRPIVDKLVYPPSCFGVSGYSGAGRTPNPRNNKVLLADGITPYKLVNHTHEREVSRHLGAPVRFSPHVAPHFRGITLTIQAQFKADTSDQELFRIFQDAYSSHDSIHVIEAMPRVQEIVNFDGAIVGGFSTNPERPNELSLVCVIDNLRKGAAGQALQNLNLALGVDEFQGLNLMPHPLLAGDQV